MNCSMRKAYILPGRTASFRTLSSSSSEEESIVRVVEDLETLFFILGGSAPLIVFLDLFDGRIVVII